MSGLEFRTATPADAPALADVVREGFETYREWAPRGWDPPPPALHLAGIRDRLPEPGCVCLFAERAGEATGVVAHAPAREEPGVAHIWMLFVRRAAWGTGLAAALLDRAVAAATTEGYAGMRLHTPAAHGRARRFYEREGWSYADPPFYEPMLGLELVTYWLGL
jgi:GNAT superfamily N-acetyltransferase